MSAVDPNLGTELVMRALEQREARLEQGFELGVELGRGGMGVVVRARQPALARDLAVKRVLRADATLESAFLSEAHVMGRLDHPNVVPVHALVRGEDGLPQLAMKLVEGTTWAARIEATTDRVASAAEHVRILLAVSNAVAYAHSRGILHRDLKPENVLLGEFGQVYVMDWGVAAAFRPEACLDSQIVSVHDLPGPVGSPSYMAPELASGDATTQGPETDVFLLGACLYEALTGTAPHAAEDLMVAIARALGGGPRTLPDEVPRDLAAICLRAMASEPTDRYASVPELVDALERHLASREARALAERGAVLVDDLRALVGREDASDENERAGETGAGVAPSRAGDGAGERDAAIVRCFHEASFALERARERLPQRAREEGPSRGSDATTEDDLLASIAGKLDEARTLLLEHALATEDVALARRALVGSTDPGSRARVDDLERTLAERAAELARLRDEATRRDWSLVAKPLAACFIASALGGALATLVVVVAIARIGLVAAKPIVALAWTLVALANGGYARHRLRAVPVPGNLASPRVFGTWAAVVLGIVVQALVGVARGYRPYEDAYVGMAMVGVGFAAMALQTRRWLLAPACAFLVGTLIVGAWPELAPLSYGLVWVVVMGGVGLALHRGARLDDPSNG